MRTYTRKRPEYQVVDDVEELCRLCLRRACPAVPIFTEDTAGVCATLPLRIMICVGLEITQEDNLPNNICEECYNELERSYAFRKKCEMTYQRLKCHVIAVKEKEFSKAMKVTEDSMAKKEETEPQQRLVLTINEDQQVELVNVVNLDSEKLESLEELSGRLEKIDETPEILDQEPKTKEVQMQDVTTTTATSSTANSSLSLVQVVTSSSDINQILSTMLVELGVMREEENGLVLADDNLRTIELEGENDTKVVLQLVEEDIVQIHIETVECPTEESQPAPKPKKPQKEDLLPIPKKEISLSVDQVPDGKTRSSLGPLRCSLCGKRFASRSALARHARAHAGQRPHACRVCARRFAQRTVMLRHELVHSAERPFKCPECPKSFTQRGALDAHARTHAHALALHRCPHCDKVFLYASGLSRHLGTHRGRVFACSLCAKTFRDTSSLRRHTLRAHPAPPAPLGAVHPAPVGAVHPAPAAIAPALSTAL